MFLSVGSVVFYVLGDISGCWFMGRRKTGKTRLLRHCLEWRFYATVTRDGECIVGERGQAPRFASLRECVGG